jgi:hypothetical protein
MKAARAVDRPGFRMDYRCNVRTLKDKNQPAGQQGWSGEKIGWGHAGRRVANTLSYKPWALIFSLMFGFFVCCFFSFGIQLTA